MKAGKRPIAKHPNKPPHLAYEQLMQFNQHCVAALELIEAFTHQRMIPRTERRYYSAMLQELRASASQSILISRSFQ